MRFFDTIVIDFKKEKMTMSLLKGLFDHEYKQLKTFEMKNIKN